MMIYLFPWIAVHRGKARANRLAYAIGYLRAWMMPEPIKRGKTPALKDKTEPTG
jgi:hypothetical protein